LCRLLTKLGLDLSSPTILHVDNQSAIAIARNPEFHDRTKHIEVRHHFLWQLVDDGQIQPTYLATGEQLADAKASAAKNMRNSQPPWGSAARIEGGKMRDKCT
jgi:hypothetical protein